MSSEQSPSKVETSSVPTDASAPSPHREKAMLNANAKSFVPTKLESASAPAAATTPNMSAAVPTTPGKMAFAPMTLGQMPPPLMGPPGGAGAYVMPSPNARGGYPASGAPPTFLLNPAALRGPPMVPMMAPGVAMSPLFFPPPPASPLVNVGNASLAALRSNVPPKFCCVLLVGVPGVGKTTVGRDVVAGLQEDKISWQFFSGSNYIKEGPVRQTPWETTRYVFDALGQKLDAMLAKQSTELTKGLIIDKNCKGVEDLHYLLAMLRSRGLPLVGIVSLDVQDTEVIASRIGGGEEQLERIKHHRVIQTRICEAARSMHLLRTIDASKTKEDVARSLRTMVLGLSASNPATGVKAPHGQPAHPTLPYSESSCTIVDDYIEYCTVMNNLFSMVVKGAQTFPGIVEYTPLSTKDMEHKLSTFKSNYMVRRKPDGTKYLLVNDGSGSLYLIPRHMRAVLRIPRDAWLGVPLTHVGKFVLDGDLVRLSKERSKEKFVVYDVLHWSEPNSTTNTVSRLTWSERQEKLNSHLCLETSAFYPTKTSEVIVVLQVQTSFDKAIDLVEPTDYPCEGLVFQSRRQIDETYLWRAPTSITVDLRLGSVLSTTPVADGGGAPPTPMSTSHAEGSMSMQRQYSFSDRSHSSPTDPPATRTFAVEVYSTADKAYTRLGTDTVDVRRPEVVEGSICICGIAVDAETKKTSWVFHRVRHDVSRAAYKPFVERVLKECLVSKQALMNWLQPGSGDPPAGVPQQAGGTPVTVTVAQQQVPQLGTAVQPDRPALTTAERNVTMSRGVFGMSLNETREGDRPAADAKATAAASSQSVMQHFEKAKYVSASQAQGDTMVDQLKRVIPGSVKVQGPAASTPRQQGKKSLLESVGVGNVTVVKPPSPPPAASATAAQAAKEKGAPEAKPVAVRTKTCAECAKTKNPEDGRVDKKDRRFYCFSCWANAGTEFCADCGEFAKGYRETTRRRVSPFYCQACWDAFSAKKEKEKEKKDATSDEKKGDDEEAGRSEKPSQSKEKERKPRAKNPPKAAKATSAEQAAECAAQPTTAAENLPAAEPAKGGAEEALDAPPATETA
jgi:adenylate kinase family enzyme